MQLFMNTYVYPRDVHVVLLYNRPETLRKESKDRPPPGSQIDAPLEKFKHNYKNFENGNDRKPPPKKAAGQNIWPEPN